MKIVPGIQSRIVAIREDQLDRIGAGRLNRFNFHVFLADLQNLLPWAVAPHFSGGRVNTQKLATETEGIAVVKHDFKFAGFLVQLDISRAWRVGGQTGHFFIWKRLSNWNDTALAARPNYLYLAVTKLSRY